MQTVSAHPALSHMAARVDAIVKHYRTDFTDHDVKHIETLPAQSEIVWTVREMGTHIFTKESVVDSVAHGWKGWGKAAQTAACESATAEAWHWNGYKWQPITPEKCAAIVAKWEKDAPPETEEHANARHARGGW